MKSGKPFSTWGGCYKEGKVMLWKITKTDSNALDPRAFFSEITLIQHLNSKKIIVTFALRKVVPWLCFLSPLSHSLGDFQMLLLLLLSVAPVGK